MSILKTLMKIMKNVSNHTPENVRKQFDLIHVSHGDASASKKFSPLVQQFSVSLLPSYCLLSRSGLEISPCNTASIKVRNCELGPHADQTDEMIRIYAAFHTKGLIFPNMKEKWQ